ncbi:MAG: TolC family outer membrane protein [Proteobacteria bacterium]|nr:TolC family outer membrane protein [Pseudomonadota bacterium]
MRILMASLLALATASPAVAEPLNEAMLSAVQTNPVLAAQKARLNATREALPQAWSEALPQISLSAGASNSDTDHTAPLADPPASRDWSATANGSQLLFASGRIIATTRAARAEIRGAVADYNEALQDLLLNVTTAYADMLQSQAVVQAQQTTVDNLTTLARYAQAQFDAGVVTRTDVAQAQARLAQARTLLVQSQGAMVAAVQAYIRLVGHPPADLSSPPDAASLPADLQTALDAAGRGSFVLASALAAVDQAHANVQVAASAGRPTVSLQASHSVSGEWGHNASDTQPTDDSVGLRLSWPLFQGGMVRSRIRQSDALATASNYDLVAAQRSVQESVTNSWTALASARSSVDSAQQQLTAAELAYQGIRLEQETGLRSTIDVLNQEQDLLTARLALAQAQRDLIVAERAMLASMGQLQVPNDEHAPRDHLRGRQ